MAISRKRWAIGMACLMACVALASVPDAEALAWTSGADGAPEPSSSESAAAGRDSESGGGGVLEWLGRFLFGDSADDASSSKSANTEIASISSVARVFAMLWCDDWDFAGDEMVINEESIGQRCLPYVAKDSPLYQALSDESNFQGPYGMYWRGAALHVVDIAVQEEGKSSCKVDVTYVGTQNTITREMYDEMLRDTSEQHVYSMVLEFDAQGKVVGLEEVDNSVISADQSAISGGVSTVSVPERDWGTWGLIRLDYAHAEGDGTHLDGRFEGDGTLTITESGYELTFAYPDGQVILESSGVFTTGAQATFIGTSTIEGYPIAMFEGFGSGIVMKFTDDDRSHEITVMGAQL